MSEISKVSSNNANIQTDNINKGEIKPNDTGLKKDKTDF